MTVAQLLSRLRKRLDDELGRDSDKGWTDEELIDFYANEVQRSMCRKIRRLIRDESTVAEIQATGTITLGAGTWGRFNSVKVNGIDILTGPVQFDTDLDTTAAAVAAAINAYTYPSTYYGIQYTAAATDEVVTISAATGSGATPNGYIISVTTTGNLETTITHMADGSSLCQMYLVDGQALYPKHPKILEIVSMDLTDGDGNYLGEIEKLNEGNMRAIFGTSWKTAEGQPSGYIENISSVRFYGIPTDKRYTADLVVYRLPVNTLSHDTTTDELEIPDQFQEDIIPGILALCFEKNDEETYRPNLAAKYEAQFERRCSQIGQEILARTGGSIIQGYHPGMV